MEYRVLGPPHGPSVSAIGLGTWRNFSTEDQKLTDSLLGEALDSGISFVDSADSYGDAQLALGRALRVRGRRDEVFLGSKVYFPTPLLPDEGLGRNRLVASVEATLRDLGVEHLDLVSAHRFDPDTPLEETLRGLEDCLRSGKVRFYGVSEWTGAQLRELVVLADQVGLPRPVADQTQYSPIWRVPEQAVVPVCAGSGVSVVAFWCLFQGVLTGKYEPDSAPPPGSRGDGELGFTVTPLLQERLLRRAEGFAQAAEQAGMTPAQLALAWVLHRPSVATALVGARRPGQLAENVAAVERVLPADLLQRVDSLLADVVVTDDE